MSATMLGIFVGGASRRMGGRPKGLLPAPGSSSLTLVESLVAAGRVAGLAPVLVGAAEPYAAVVPAVRRLADAPAGVGPLGGLHALVRTAGTGDAIAVACDMPYVDAAILERLARHPSAAAVVAARRAEGWEPLLARYRAPAVRPVLERALAEGVRSFQDLFERLEVEPLEIDADLGRALVDWDTPDAVERDR